MERIHGKPSEDHMSVEKPESGRLRTIAPQQPNGNGRQPQQLNGRQSALGCSCQACVVTILIGTIVVLLFGETGMSLFGLDGGESLTSIRRRMRELEGKHAMLNALVEKRFRNPGVIEALERSRAPLASRASAMERGYGRDDHAGAPKQNVSQSIMLERLEELEHLVQNQASAVDSDDKKIFKIEQALHLQMGKVEGLVPSERQPFQLMAFQLVASTPSGGLVSFNRKIITVQLSIKALVEGVPGDFVETGVFNGGTSILMAKVLKTYASPDRVLWSCDSFKGLPPDDDQAVKAGRFKDGDSFLGKRQSDKVGFAGEYSEARATFESNIQYNGLAKSNRIKILEGFFIDTLPTAPIKTISFLRLDGDIYVSTKQPLDILYERLSIGGYIYIDDYGSYKGCRLAVDEFRKQHNIWDPMIPVYESPNGEFEAVWWQKKTPIGSEMKLL